MVESFVQSRSALLHTAFFCAQVTISIANLFFLGLSLSSSESSRDALSVQDGGKPSQAHCATGEGAQTQPLALVGTPTFALRTSLTLHATTGGCDEQAPRRLRGRGALEAGSLWKSLEELLAPTWRQCAWFGDWLYGHFEAYVPDPDWSRPGTPQGRCLGTKQAQASRYR